MNRIETFEDACKALNLGDPAAVLPNLDFFPEHHRKALTAHAKLIIIAEAMNEGWKPDWDNNKQWKYYPWFDMRNSSGVGFSFVDCVNGDSASSVGSRLCYRTRELAEYAGKQFQDLYNEFFQL